jgi:hypothetical protein
VCWLAGDQLDVVEPDTAAPVQVGDELAGERDRVREALPDGPARRHFGDVVLSQRPADQFVGVQRFDELDFPPGPLGW